MKSRREQTSKEKKAPIKFYFGLALIFLLIGYPIYFLIRSGVASHKLSSDSQTIKGVVIDEKKFTGHSPVNQTFYYSYEFRVDGKIYKGNTENSKYAVGDSVEVEYAKSNPDYNRIKKN
ncbi:DUF3592 domain-containing protein [Dyadobacter diqingensis]|uniref:DUF3592 domain-containing protein n=1 Tax=Dyadobacter diqingensis TaxID=2938121 RepID=UPI0020C23F13|nr:DUF3592 domain-containing protein [Dyadobacter diqingensis]